MCSMTSYTDSVCNSPDAVAEHADQPWVAAVSWLSAVASCSYCCHCHSHRQIGEAALKTRGLL